MKDNKITKGIVLAGGSGTRLHPITKVVSKQLLPIYNKPMIYYPLSILIKAGIKDIVIITTPDDQDLFKRLLMDGSQWDVRINYEIQEKPEGIAQAFLITRDWVGDSNSVLILGDNLFFGHSINNIVKESILNNKGATIFGYKVEDPSRFGVIEFDDESNVISIEEKPSRPKSEWAATGLYIYNSTVIKKAENLKKSKRGELEITDINQMFLNESDLKVVLLDENFSWLDTGTHNSLLEASNYVKKIKEEFGEDIIGLL